MLPPKPRFLTEQFRLDQWRLACESIIRERVRQAIDELGYTVNRQAQSLARGQTYSIGVLAPDLGIGYIGAIVSGIDAELENAGYDLIVFTTHRRTAKEASHVASLVQSVVDGLLLILPRGLADYFAVFGGRHFPHVLIDHRGVGTNSSVVGCTNLQGGYYATEYLIKLGHRRIGFITGLMEMVFCTGSLGWVQGCPAWTSYSGSF